MDERQLRARFEHHPPSSDRVVMAHEEVRRRFTDLALWLNEVLPDGLLGGEKDRAMAALDDGCMHANACIARTQLQ